MIKYLSKTYGNGVTETINYNIQGWQTATAVTNGSSNIYSQQLKYYNPSKGTAPLYTGNISEWSTTMGSQAMNTYGFEYDKLGRLKNSNLYSGENTIATASYTEKGITYDKNGNIQTLERYGANGQQPESDYQYDYIGNQLTSIGKGQGEGCTTLLYSYEYDSNGNMRSDGLKNLQISYNFLNLPSVVTQDATPVAEYGWFADGSKYRVLTQQNNGYIYTGSLIYASNNGNLQIESTDFTGGRINLAQTGSMASGTNNTGSTLTQDIHYFHTDHLGSVRAITNQGGSVVEQNAYYPFGSRHTFGNTYAQTTNRFKFNGKEEQTTGNLNYLDYGARMYDNKIGRWLTQDPLSEKYYAYSSYNYCVNNPVMFVDPDGRFVLDKETEQQYPALANFLRNMLNEWHNKSNDFKNAFYSTSGMNDKQVVDMLTYGQGPQIYVEDLSKRPDGSQREAPQGDILQYKDIFGYVTNKGNGVIRLDINKTVGYLENAKTREEVSAAKLLVESTIYHESTHYGNAERYGKRNGIYKESGKIFEKRAYNKDVSFSNYIEIYQNLYAPTKLQKIKTPITTIYYDK